ncbi:endonuclease YncB(thermonuclease family) [Aminobacter lissarensis]|uniref:Endonuclease YncB(Thermonuclease family) n=1 Tax=Aminobacter carboxidus TaxID=376165 RepID=A0A8E1WBD6_9HYPH|nr:thermonuclease family protein [Aminobacter lissarensis]MBB6465586.1 endonuclease YncB(thermonuclease family) [Aminobacter lissarensis]
MVRTATVLIFIALAQQALAQGPVIGRASVIDGDTIEIAGERIRFNGVDAPESWQVCHDGNGKAYRCGQAAANALDAFLGASRPTRCEYHSRDRYRRFVGDCFRADGESVARWLVRNGHALDWPRYSRGAYAPEQAKARADRYGMWQGDFLEPWEARRLR